MTIEQFCEKYPWYIPIDLSNGNATIKAVYNPHDNSIRLCKPLYSFGIEFRYDFETIRQAKLLKKTHIIKVTYRGKTYKGFYAYPGIKKDVDGYLAFLKHIKEEAK